MDDTPGAPDAIGFALRDARMAAGIPQNVLALTLGISVWTLNRLEHGKRRFDEAWLTKLPAEIRAPVALLLSNRTRRHLWHLRNLGSVPPAA